MGNSIKLNRVKVSRTEIATAASDTDAAPVPDEWYGYEIYAEAYDDRVIQDNWEDPDEVPRGDLELLEFMRTNPTEAAMDLLREAEERGGLYINGSWYEPVPPERERQEEEDAEG